MSNKNRRGKVDVAFDRISTWRSSLPTFCDLYLERKCVWPVLSTCWLPSHEDNGDAWLLSGTGTGGSPDMEDGGSCLKLFRVNGEKPSMTLVANLHPADIKHNADIDRVRASQDSNGQIRIAIKSNEERLIVVSEVDLSSEEFSINGTALPSLVTFSPSSASRSRPDADWEPAAQGLDWSNTSIASSCKNGMISLHDLASGNSEAITAHQTPGKCTNDCVFPSSDLIASAGEDGTLSLCDCRILTKPIFSFLGHRGAANSISSSPDGLMISSCGLDNCVKVWDTRALSNSMTIIKSLFNWGSHRCPVVQVEWSPSQDHILASADSSGLIFLWSTMPQLDHTKTLVGKRPEIQMVMGGHVRAVDDINFHSKRPILASASGSVFVQGDRDQEGLTAETLVQDNNLIVWRPVV